MHESRLFKILYYLLDKGRATAPELAARFEVSARTIYRDIDALSGAGIPVYTEAGRGGGICLMNHFVLDRAMFTEAEKQDILSALQSVAVIGNMGGEEVLEKLSALFQIRSENWYEVDFARWGVSTGDNEKFELLKKAVLTHRRVKIFYAGSGREKSYRTVEPQKLLYKSRSKKALSQELSRSRRPHRRRNCSRRVRSSQNYRSRARSGRKRRRSFFLFPAKWLTGSMMSLTAARFGSWKTGVCSQRRQCP